MKGQTILMLCFCIALTHGQGNNYGMWGDWSEASACSRTCGGGVAHRTRKCHHGIPGVSRGCQGDDIKYESCNTQACPEGLESFRSVQCGRFNNQQTTWVPYQDDKQACALVCQARETGRVQVLQDIVVDGTECDSPDRLGICLGGVCQEVGCDRRIDSRLKEDRCLVCGGRGDTCQTVTGTVTDSKLHPGENHVATIPQASTSITLREVTSDSASIVLTGRDGTVYLDSRQPPSDGDVVTVAGARFRYRRSTESGGSHSMVLRGRGPINDTVLVKLNYRTDRAGVEFEYSVPRERVLEDNPTQPYTWIFGAWTSCSRECGDGYQLRAVSCIDRSSGGSVADEKCDQARKPDSRQGCNVKPCGRADTLYRWVPGHWGQCSVQCGVGEQTQEMYCVETGANGDTVYVSEDLCERYSEKHPVYKRACEGDGEECPYWATTAWTECSVTCGYGRQTREVVCQRDPADPTSVPVTLDDSQCTQEQPDTHMVCRLDPCADGSNAHRMVEVEDSSDCEDSPHGCCSDGVTAASGPSGQGCPTSSTLINVCLLEPERGPCSDYSIKWHFVPQEQKCRRFWYGGCQGNQNRFETEEACEAKCLQKDSAAENLATGDCTSRVYGCCQDGVTPARGPNQEGCPVVAVTPATPCRRSRFGCCPDGVTAASGPNQRGCSSDNSANEEAGDRGRGQSGCQRSRYGCCSDGVTAARGPNQEGCGREVRLQRKCEQSYYGCCPGSDVAAQGANQQGCSSAPNTAFDPAMCSEPQDRGTCSDYSVKWFYNSTESRCARFWYGGCGGNGNRFDSEEQCKLGCVDVTGPALCRLPAVAGPCRARHQRYYYNHKVGKCQTFIYGGCKGNANRFRSQAECQTKCGGSGTSGSPTDANSAGDSDSDRGNEILPSNQVDLCAVSTYGCCRDGVTAAGGPDYQGCDEPCQSSLYGCCEDGATPAQGRNKEGCAEAGSGDYGDCEDTTYGCCADGVTAASGPNQRGCPATTTTPTTTPSTTTVASGVDRCALPSERGPCVDYVVRWFHDSSRQECAQFWYGGCPGNDNRFETRDDCEAECMATEAPVTEDPDFVSICDMPRDPGPCRAQLPRWFYDPLDRQCRTFSYSGCQGNENNFVSLQECQQTCMGLAPTAAPTTTTTPAPYTFNPPPATSSLVMTGSERVQEGTELRLTCRAEGPSAPTALEWFINGKRVGREHDFLSIRATPLPSEHALSSELVISRSRKENTATYYCRSIPYSDVQRKTVIVSKTVEMRTTTEAPVVRPEEPDRGSSDPSVVCRMPKEPGTCRGYFRRWFYDAEVQRCRQFVYGGCDGNSNNFESEQDCQEYCKKDDSGTDSGTKDTTDPEEVCRMPAVTGNCRANLQRWYYDASYRLCRQFVYGGCSGNSNNFETEQDCLNYCKRDDSGTDTDTGATDSTDPNVVCQLPVQRGSCRARLPRYHYNSEKGQCLRFYYGGCDGNSNNFETEEDCNDYCRAEDICQQPKVVGPCRAGHTRYYYDAAAGACRQFTYGGCQGNLNNFGTLQACQRKCTQKPKDKEVCKLNPDAGTCRGYNIRWYYDSSVQRCQRFVYTGCDGNDNRFDSEDECMDFCGSGVDTVITPAPTQPSGDVCTMPRERGTCRDFEVLWYYDVEKAYCTRFYYGGCGGNGNRFNSRQECEQRCVRRQPDPVTTTTAPPRRRSCSYSRYGCCPDGITPAIDAYRTNCRDDSVIVRPSGDGNVVLATRGSMAILDCYSPGSAVSWYRDGYYLMTDSRFQIHNNGTLVIKNISDDISGTYSCRINDGNNIPQIRRYELKLKTRYLPGQKVPLSILQTPPTIRVGPGDHAYLHCQAFGTPTPSIAWTYKESPVRSGGRFIVFNNGTLMVSAVTQRDTGTYTCTAQNGVDHPVSRDMQLVLAQNLVAKIQSHSGVVMEGETARLRCDVNGYPPPSVTWEKDGVAVTSESAKMYVQGGNTLVVPRVGIEDAGLYTCVAKNAMGTARDLTYLQVKLQSHRDKCTNTMSKMKCRLIVSARLCGHRMFSRRCCQSCRQAGLLRK